MILLCYNERMLHDLLNQIGLTDNQSAAYLCLITSGAMSPPQVAKKLSITRTNAYKVLDALTELHLATKIEEHKKIMYRADNPAHLDTLLKKQRDEVLQREATFKASLPNLLNHYFSHATQPGVRHFEGSQGIKQILGDILRTGQPLYLIRSTADVHFFDQKFFADYRRKRANQGIPTEALTVYSESAVQDPVIDKLNKFQRTWLPKNSYTAPVEWNIYGDKVAAISYDTEAMGLIIDSPQIAESMRQIFKLMQAAHLAK